MDSGKEGSEGVVGGKGDDEAGGTSLNVAP